MLVSQWAFSSKQEDNTNPFQDQASGFQLPRPKYSQWDLFTVPKHWTHITQLPTKFER